MRPLEAMQGGKQALATRLFVAMSGGAAKGIAHVGAMRAIEDSGELSIKALAGTSAGAIVAALLAAGYKASELIDRQPDGRITTIFDTLAKSRPAFTDATRIFGRWGWARIEIARRLSSVMNLKLMGVGAVVVVALAMAVSPDTWLGATIALVAMIALMGIALRVGLGGLADLDAFRDALGDLLIDKVRGPEGLREPVLMREFGVDGRACLKIVAANLSTRRLQLFSPERTPDVAVADAVMASVAIPGIFRLPVFAIGGGAPQTFADGGLVSNLPAWCFDEERELDPDAYTLSLDIADAPLSGKALDRFGWLGAAVRTSLFGSDELNMRAVARGERFSLQSRSGLTQFNASRAFLWEEVELRRRETNVAVLDRLVEVPRLYRDANHNAVAVTTQALVDHAGLVTHWPENARVRAAVALRDFGYGHSLRLRHSVFFEGCADERLLLPTRGSIVGTAYREKRSVMATWPFDDDHGLPGEENRLRRALVWGDLRWSLCVPIFIDDKDEPQCVVSVDGDHELAADSAAQKRFVDEVAAKITGLFETAIIFDKRTEGTRSTWQL